MGHELWGTAVTDAGDQVFDYDEAAAFLRFSRRKLEGLVSERKIPSVLDGNRRIFLKSQLIEWVAAKARASMKRSAKLQALP